MKLRYILAIALVHGLIYVFLVPPWQHYDEPGHFELAWSFAVHDQLPTNSAIDNDARRKIMRSMIDHAFFDPSQSIDLDAMQDPISLGYSQLDEKPAYYIWAGLWIKVVKSFVALDMTQALYVARLASFSMFLVTIVAAFYATQTVTQAQWPGPRYGEDKPPQPINTLPWLVALFLALLPAFVDTMTSVRSDAAVVMFTCLFIFSAVQLFYGKCTALKLLLFCSSAALAFYAKNTSYPLLLAAPAVILPKLITRLRWWMVWGAMSGVALCGLLLSLRGLDPADWLRVSGQDSGMRCHIPACQPVIGQSAFRLTSGVGAARQIIDPQQLAHLKTKTLSLGGWMWTDDKPGISQSTMSPVLFTGAPHEHVWQPKAFKTVTISSSPTFVFITATIQADQDRAWIGLNPSSPNGETGQPIYFDGLVLADYDVGPGGAISPPTFDDDTGLTGRWGGRAFVNYVRNPSADLAGLYLDSKASQWGQKLIRDNQPAAIFSSLFDQVGLRWYTKLAGDLMFETFWARFGWGHVQLFWSGIYTLLWGATVAAIGSAIIQMLSNAGKSMQMAVLWGPLAALSLLFTITFGHYTLYWFTWLAPFRYSWPAILPIAWCLVYGWRGIARIFKIESVFAFALPLLILATASLVSIANFYGYVRF